ncbi:MAG: peptidyl-prolyl cis-trans isomerase [Caldisericia bacterium]|nr:peptidyl-prolyl cis-trans isomerase [Caldisericia bacterium]
MMARKKQPSLLKKQKNASKRYWFLAIPAVLLIVFAIVFTWLFQTRDIVARIGSQTITKAEIELEKKRLTPSNFEETLKNADEQEKQDMQNTIDSKAWENLLKLKCLYLYAREEMHIKVTKADIDKEVAAFKLALNNGDPNGVVDVKSALAEYRISYKSFRRDMREQSLYNKVLEPVKNEVTATEEELKEHYSQYAANYNIPEQAHVLLISVNSEEDSKKILKELQEGKDFTQLAREKSLSSDAAQNGGDIGWQTRDSLYKEISDNVFHPDMPLNKPSVMQGRDAWYVFIVKERKAAETKTYEQIKDDVKKDLIAIKQNSAVDSFMYRLTEKYESRVVLGSPWESLLNWWDKIRGKIE